MSCAHSGFTSNFGLSASNKLFLSIKKHYMKSKTIVMNITTPKETLKRNSGVPIPLHSSSNFFFASLHHPQRNTHKSIISKILWRNTWGTSIFFSSFFPQCFYKIRKLHSFRKTSSRWLSASLSEKDFRNVWI